MMVQSSEMIILRERKMDKVGTMSWDDIQQVRDILSKYHDFSQDNLIVIYVDGRGLYVEDKKPPAKYSPEWWQRKEARYSIIAKVLRAYLADWEQMSTRNYFYFASKSQAEAAEKLANLIKEGKYPRYAGVLNQALVKHGYVLAGNLFDPMQIEFLQEIEDAPRVKYGDHTYDFVEQGVF